MDSNLRFVPTESNASERKFDLERSPALPFEFLELLKHSEEPHYLSNQDSHEAIRRPNKVANVEDKIGHAYLNNSFSLNLAPESAFHFGASVAAGTLAVTAGEAAKVTVEKKVLANFTDKNIRIGSYLSERVSDLRNRLEIDGQLASKEWEQWQQRRSAELDLKAAENELREVAKMHHPSIDLLKGDADIVVKQRQSLFMHVHSEINELGHHPDISAKQFIGTPKEVQNYQKYFVTGSREANCLLSLEYSRKNFDLAKELLTTARNESEAAEANFVKARDALKNSSYGNAIDRGIRSGFLLSAATVTGGYAADKLLGSESAEHSIPRLVLDGAVVPTVIASGLPARVRLPIAAAAFAGSRVIGIIENAKRA